MFAAKLMVKNAPRVPAGRLGTKVDVDFADGWSGLAEYSHVFKQDKITAFERETDGYNMVNLGVAYSGQLKDQNDYRVYFKANNLLDEDVYSTRHSLPIFHKSVVILRSVFELVSN